MHQVLMLLEKEILLLILLVDLQALEKPEVADHQA